MFGPEFPGATRGRFGEGRVAYLPKLEQPDWPSTRPEVWYFFNQFWSVVDNAEELLEALDYVAVEWPWSVTCTSGIPLAEGLATKGGGKALHVVNLDPEQPLRDLELSVACDTAPQEVMPLGPGMDYQALAFDYDAEAKRVRFGFGEAQRYVMFHIH